MFRLAMIQMLVEGGAKEANLARAEARIAEAAAGGARVALLPEALDLGWTHPSALTDAEPIPGGESFERLAAAARRHGVYVCAGLTELADSICGAELRPGPDPNCGAGLRPASSEGQQKGMRGGPRPAAGAVYNAAVLIGPGGDLLLRHRKLNELEIGHPYYAQGRKLEVVETPLGAVGLMICADAFARGRVVTRSLALMGADVILSPCAWAVPADHDNAAEPYGPFWIDTYQPVARDFSIWLAAVSNVGAVAGGPWAGRRCIGCSLAIDADGNVAAHLPYGERAEEIRMLDIAPVPRPARGDGWARRVAALRGR